MADRSIVFDRMADRYDETRGGAERARIVADALTPWLPSGPVVEIGVGTGLIAAALGRRVCGLDLSAPMLARAFHRLGPLLVRGDVLDLPMRPSSLAAIVAVHVLHLVPDLDGALDQAVASLRPGGRLLVSGIEGDRLPADEIGAVFGDLDERLRRYPAPTVERLESAGFALVHDGLMAPLVVQQSPTEAADQLAARTWSWCWDIPADRWRGEVEPVIAALRALPDPDAPRDRRLERRFVVLERR